MFSLSDKKMIITGATGGIGKAIATKAGESGAILTLSGSREETLETIKPDFSGAHFLPCDLSDAEQPAQLVKQATEAMGGLDVLVCNAGLTQDNLAMRMKDEEWQRVIDVNLTASFKLARAAIKPMMKQRTGRIIFITSVVGHSGNPGQANYCASKAGLCGMAKSLAQEVGSRGITVNCIAPGFIATSMTDALNDEQKTRITQNIPLGSMGTATDIAAATQFLASDASGYITGQTLHVNGGLYM